MNSPFWGNFSVRKNGLESWTYFPINTASRLQGNDGPIIEPAASQLVKSLLWGVKSRLVCRDSFQLTTTMNVTWTTHYISFDKF